MSNNDLTHKGDGSSQPDPLQDSEGLQARVQARTSNSATENALKKLRTMTYRNDGI
jgi:hypothetical protein